MISQQQAHAPTQSSARQTAQRPRSEHRIWHVQHTGRCGSSIFLQAREYQSYLTDLVCNCRACDVRIHAWCLIRNDVQLMLGNVSRAGLRQLMTRLAARHVFRQCKGDELPDFVFEPMLQIRRLYAADDILAVAGEIDLLPVRRVLVCAPDRYPWSSYADRSGIVTSKLLTRRETILAKFTNTTTITDCHNIVDPEAAYLDLAGGPNARGLAYRQLVENRISQLQRRILVQVDAAEKPN